MTLIWATEQGEGWSFALLPRSMRHLGIEPRGVLHVGAHHGEELPHYRAAGFDAVLLVEPDPANVRVILDRPDVGPAWGVYLIEGACGSTQGEAPFYSQTQSWYSGLEARNDRDANQVLTVEVAPVAELQRRVPVAGQCNVLVVDTQGTEIDAVQSADLEQFDLVIVECYQRQRRTGRFPGVLSAANHEELDAWMAEQGWAPAIRWVYDDSGYFDQLYTRKQG